jgi:hypothetical protein
MVSVQHPTKERKGFLPPFSFQPRAVPGERIGQNGERVWQSIGDGHSMSVVDGVDKRRSRTDLSLIVSGAARGCGGK